MLSVAFKLTGVKSESPQLLPPPLASTPHQFSFRDLPKFEKMRGRGNYSQGFGQRRMPTGPSRGGYNAPSGAPRGRGGYSANSSANGYINGSAYGNANANADNGRYRLKLDVKYYLRPHDCIDQLEILAGHGMSRKDTTCLHCGGANIFGHNSYHLLRDGSCPRRCCRCGTMNHQGCVSLLPYLKVHQMLMLDSFVTGYGSLLPS